jgi:hypothetical protein
MAAKDPKYDVAISFLASDTKTAEELYRGLIEKFDVFFFPEKQEDLAGTEGMESMRTPFYEDSRVNVVLYRENWGKTRWTAVEERAIKDACFDGEWNKLFFIALDSRSALPKWLPTTHVRYNMEDFGLEGAVGAIKARVLENLGTPKPMTPVKQAAIVKADDEFRNDRRQMLYGPNQKTIEKNVESLFQEIAKHCDDVNSQRNIEVRHGMTRQGIEPQGYLLSDGRVGLIAIWRPPRYVSEAGQLAVQEYNSRLYPPPDRVPQIRVHPPVLLNETIFEPEISRAREYGWRKRGSDDFVSSSDLASQCVMAFLKVVEMRNNGTLEGPRSF